MRERIVAGAWMAIGAGLLVSYLRDVYYGLTGQTGLAMLLASACAVALAVAIVICAARAWRGPAWPRFMHLAVAGALAAFGAVLLIVIEGTALGPGAIAFALILFVLEFAAALLALSHRQAS